MEKSDKTHIRYRSIQQLLLTNFVLLAAIILLVSAILFSRIQYQLLKDDAEKNLRYTADTVADTVDLQISEMSTISMNAIRLCNYEDLYARYEQADAQSLERNTLRLQLANVLTTAKGFDFSVRQLNIYGEHESGFGTGSFNGSLSATANSQAWYTEAIQKDGGLFIEDAAPDEFLSDSANIAPDTLYFAVVRRFFNSMHQPVGFAEVKKYYNTVFSSALHPESSANTDVYIFDSDGRQIFPAEKSDSISAYYERKDQGDGDFTDPATGSREYVAYATADKSDIVVAVKVSNSEFLAPIKRSIATIIMLFLLLFALSFLFAEFLAGKISRPIKEIYQFLNQDHADDFEELDMKVTGVREIDKLKDSLNEDIQAKRAATDTLMTLKEKEMQAQMLALQSQMNPHFLYNSLATIAEMAEEGQTDNVSQMCSDITEILRYISSNKSEDISLEEELEMCDLYLECMKFRYQKELTYNIEVEDVMLEARIPKLCLQLLVENALKYTTKQSPPWNVTIKGYTQENHWYLQVLDNGPGFDPEVCEKLHVQMDEILQKRILPSLQIHGMGILNVFIRLYLRDGKPFLFDFGTRPQGGAYVTIGGKLDDTDSAF